MSDALWTQFFDTPISGNAKLLALRLAREPFKATDVEMRNTREFAMTLRMSPFEYEQAFHELRHPDIAWLTTHFLDRPMLKAGALPRMLMDGVPSVEAIQAKQTKQAAPIVERVSFHKENKR